MASRPSLISTRATCASYTSAAPGPSPEARTRAVPGPQRDSGQGACVKDPGHDSLGERRRGLRLGGAEQHHDAAAVLVRDSLYRRLILKAHGVGRRSDGAGCQRADQVVKHWLLFDAPTSGY
jgi:hypothetical protein